MNKRIKELAKQAGYYQEQDVDGSRFDAMPRQCFEKFAELIVRECTNIVLHYTDVDEGVAVAKKHFGVEE